MKKFYLMLLALILVCVLAACGGDSKDEGADNTGSEGETETEPAGDEEDEGDGESASVEAGEEVFQNNCTGCHGQDMAGGSGPDLTEIGSKYSQNEIADIVENGTDGGMPAFKDLEGDELDELTNWLSEHK
ncbi:c-type cytochrome [Oceanobacillus neutriphilus]|uniref:Cytochrome c domain-containing protein n=1 Tax=Oceanobacillus neutriphilus TaxID=531815 RepID=A0ABQ2P1R6_9BACI|nr:cytochrome c [Oceanobacillus neutriphilus]GGP15901.1 hypothetical protein GCM10011346_45570 [Oceanobacillus neutriphilus]